MATPSITIQDWSKSLRKGELGRVLFALTVPAGQQIVSITATLTAEDGQRVESMLAATNANVAMGIVLPSVPVGRYRLTMQILDNLGGSDTTSLKRDVVVS